LIFIDYLSLSDLQTQSPAQAGLFLRDFLRAMSDCAGQERPLGNSTILGESAAKQNLQLATHTTHRQHPPETAAG
jgi:hypothetical protein